MSVDDESLSMRTTVRRFDMGTEANKVSKSETSFQDHVLAALERSYDSDKAAAADMEISKGEFSKLKRSGRWGDLLDKLSDSFWQELTAIVAEARGMEVRYTEHQIERQMLKTQTELQKLQHMFAVSRNRRATDR